MKEISDKLNFIGYIFLVIPKKSLPYPRSCRFSLVLFSKSFKFLFYMQAYDRVNFLKDIRIVFHYLYVDVQCSNTFVDDKTLYDYYLNKLLSLGSIKIKKIRSFYFIFFLQYSIFLHVDLNFLTSIFFPPLQRTHFNIV